MSTVELPTEAGNNHYGPWSERLERLTGELRVLVDTTEDEFLAIGAKLSDFHRCSGEIVRMSADVVDQVAGEKMKGAINDLEKIFNCMGSYLTHTENEAGQSAQALGEIRRLLGEAAEPLAGFKKMNKVLCMFGTSTKIESARIGLDAAGFDTLAEEVKLLAERVNEKSRSIHEQKEALSNVIRQTLVLVLATEAEQRGHVRMIFEKTRSSLAALADINSQCADAAVALTSFSQEVTRNIGEVVVSMQFHDIVRQKVEHVRDVLEGLIGRLREKTGEPLSQELICEIGDLCELQAAQLSHATEELVTAVESIIENLRQVAGKEMRMSSETRRIAGIADRTGDSFFEEMENGLTIVKNALGKSVTANCNLSAAMTTVASTVAEIASFIEDIGQIWEEIELISLNAQIKSARIGKGGAPLGVIAEAIQRLSADTFLRTTSVSDIIIGINEAAAHHCREVTNEISGMDEEVAQMMDDLSGLSASLRRVSENLLSSLSLMDGEVQLLSTEIENVTAGITAHLTVARLLGESVGGLSGIVREARALVTDDVKPQESKSLTELVGRYTMHSERRVHQSVTGVVSCLPEPNNEKAAVNREGVASELGDNVELF